MLKPILVSIGLLSIPVWHPCGAPAPVLSDPPKAATNMIKVIVNPPKADYQPGIQVTLLESGRLLDLNGHHIPEKAWEAMMRPKDKKARYVYVTFNDQENTTLDVLARTLAKLKKAAVPGHETIIIVHFRGLEDE